MLLYINKVLTGFVWSAQVIFSV